MPALVQAQSVPRSATPRGVVVVFLTETCSASEEFDRALFRERFIGELAGEDPARFRSTIPGSSRVRIDSIPDVRSADSLRRAVAFVTVSVGGETDNSYIYLRRDSIWRIEAIRRLVPTAQREQIRRAAQSLDTSVQAFRLRRADLLHLLLPDDSLAALFRQYVASAERVMSRLGDRRWSRFGLRDVDFAAVDEYRELDDDVPAGEIIFYQIDRKALEHLKRGLGIRRIERDRRYPSLVFLQAAAIEKSHYGYLYSPTGVLPELTADEFIAIRPVTARWWLYKRIGAQ